MSSIVLSICDAHLRLVPALLGLYTVVIWDNAIRAKLWMQEKGDYMPG